MQTKRLGNSDLDITPIGVGAWAMGGGGWEFAWGPQDDDESIAAIHAALDRGINWIDTAAVYGLGHSEEVVAQRAEGPSRNGRMSSPSASASGTRSGEIGKSLKATRFAAKCEDSLRRLKVDVIDLYQIHWPEPDEDIEEGWATLAELQKRGKSALDRRVQFQRGADGAVRRRLRPITSLQPPYSMISPEIETEILPLLRGAQYRRDRVFADEIGLLTGAMTRERLPACPRTISGEAHAAVPGAAADAESGAGGAAAGDRRAARADAWRSGDCVDAAAARR